MSVGYLFAAAGLGAVAQDKSADAARAYSESAQSSISQLSASVTSVGYADPDVILVFANNPTTAIYAKQGDTVNGINLVRVNGPAVIGRANGQDFSMEINDKCLAVPCYQLQDYLINLTHRIDQIDPGVTERIRVTLGPGGMPLSDTSTVSYFRRAMPFGPLPDGAASITFDVWYGPGKETQARMVSVQLAKPFVREIVKPAE